MKTTLLLATALLFAAVPTFAQVPTIASVKVDLARVAAPTVIVSTVTVPIGSFTCNLAKTTLPTVTVNPEFVEFEDPALPLRACKASILATINARPPDQYTASAAFLYSDAQVGGTSLPSNPFTVFTLATPLGLKVVR
jgi:hypothetical protein